MTDVNHKVLRRRASVLRNMLRSEAGGGVVLMLAALAALVIANSPLAPSYFDLLKTYVGGLNILHWINDGLMALFFLVVGLEIKREFIDGELSSWRRRILPGVAAAGGMIVPAAIYIAFNLQSPETLKGWAVPTATDIAFALGVLSLLGRRVPVSLKIFLTALAIIDDLGAVVIIAAFYTADLSLAWLASAGAVLLVLFALNRAGIERLAVYLIAGACLWFFVLQSGIHATLAGVALSLFIPIRLSPGRPDDVDSPLHILEHKLHPWVAFAVVPIFGFANAGLSFSGLSWQALLAPVPVGIAAGLFAGKQIGVFGFTWVTIRLGAADCPANASWAQVYGVTLLCGIGFTMSLFIGLLAFPEDPLLQSEVKIGVMMGSLLSGLVGAAVLLLAKSDCGRTALPEGK